MRKEKFLKEVNRLKGTKTNLKAHKVHLGLIDDIWGKIDSLDWDNKLDSVYTKYQEARSFADGIVSEATSEYEGIRTQLDFLENALEELGVPPMASVDEGINEADKIERQIGGLIDDLNSGVLA
jgi:hypothetical protein